MEILNNFKIISGIQNFAALLKSKDFLIPVQILKSVKCEFEVNICVALDIEMQSSCPKESSLIDHIKKADHYIILVLYTSVVNKNSNFRHLMVVTA